MQQDVFNQVKKSYYFVSAGVVTYAEAFLPMRLPSADWTAVAGKLPKGGIPLPLPPHAPAPRSWTPGPLISTMTPHRRSWRVRRSLVRPGSRNWCSTYPITTT